MKLYDYAGAPSPRRVRIFLAEKGIKVPTEQVDIRNKGQFTPEFRRLNPGCTVPVLVLDDGTCISESAAICRYFEELQPEPSLLGRSPKEKALIEMWNRRVEFGGYLAAADVLRNSVAVFEGRGLPGVEGGMAQIPALVERGRATLGRFFARLDRQLADNEFVAGGQFSVPDITALVTVDFAARAGVAAPAELTALARWHAAVSARPSASA